MGDEAPQVRPIKETVIGSFHVALTQNTATTLTSAATFTVAKADVFTFQPHPSNTANVFIGASTVTDSNGYYLGAPVDVTWDHNVATMFGYTTTTGQKIIVTAWK